MASGTLSPGIRVMEKKVQITYDTDDIALNKNNTTAEAKTVADGVQFLFMENTPGEEHPHFHASGVIPSCAVRIRNTKPTLNFKNGNVKALYEIEVTDREVFTSSF